MSTLVSEFKTGTTCKWCGDRGPIYRDNECCEQCDNDVFRCSICKEDHHVENLCRHVFRNSRFEWIGSGACSNKNVKRSFLKLLSLMPADFADDLRKAIRSGRFHTWLVAPLIGGGGCLSLYGMPDRDGQSMLHKWGDALINIGEGDHAEEAADGYHWLVSLYDKKTPGANRTTTAWISEYLNARAVLTERAGA